VKITEDFLAKIASQKGGWNSPQLALLGVDWPPKKGWKQNVLGLEISEETASQLESLRESTPLQRKAIREAEKAGLRQTDLFE
jgi:hypothetical protein